MTKKRIFLIVLACFLVMTASFGVTYAYLVSADDTVNEFTVGENIIEVTEDKYTPPDELKPGITFDKNPCVKNTGNLPCYVRMRADFSDSTAKDFCELIGLDETNWEYDVNDGYYYYNKLLDPNDSTTELFTQVHIKETKEDGTDYTAEDMIDFDILIYAESCRDDGSGNYKTVWR